MQLDSINFFYEINFLKFLQLILWIRRNPPLHRNLGDTKGDNRKKKIKRNNASQNQKFSEVTPCLGIEPWKPHGQKPVDMPFTNEATRMPRSRPITMKFSGKIANKHIFGQCCFNFQKVLCRTTSYFERL